MFCNECEWNDPCPKDCGTCNAMEDGLASRPGKLGGSFWLANFASSMIVVDEKQPMINEITTSAMVGVIFRALFESLCVPVMIQIKNKKWCVHSVTLFDTFES